MKKLLFRLDGVPEDEAIEVRALLDEEQIDYYETPGGLWGISVAGLWVADAEVYRRAKPHLERYASERQARVRAEYRQQVEQGEAETLFDRFRQRPFTFLLTLAFIAFILYLSTIPFMRIAGN